VLRELRISELFFFFFFLHHYEDLICVNRSSLNARAVCQMMKYQCNETINNNNKLQSLTKHSEWYSYKQLNNCKLYFMLTPATIYPHGYEATHWGECGLESQWGHGCLSLVSVVCCQVVV
jgi:hypothetical protein